MQNPDNRQVGEGYLAFAAGSFVLCTSSQIASVNVHLL